MQATQCHGKLFPIDNIAAWSLLRYAGLCSNCTKAEIDCWEAAQLLPTTRPSRQGLLDESKVSGRTHWPQDIQVPMYAGQIHPGPLACWKCKGP